MAKIEQQQQPQKLLKKKELESTMAYLSQLLGCTYNEAIDFAIDSKPPNRHTALLN